LEFATPTDHQGRAAGSAKLMRRVLPVQERARQRIALILSVTEDLLATGPADKITTSMIATAADVPVSSIYRYFPNVQAIFKEMFERLTGDLHRRIQEIVDDSERLPSWRARYLEVMGHLRSLFDESRAYRPLLTLMLTSSELRVVKQQANAQIADHLGRRWARGEDGFHGGDPHLVARMATEIFTSCEAMLAGLSTPAQGRAEDETRFFLEIAVVLERYLAPYLDADA